MKHTAASITRRLDLTGKTALITGATSGLGRECARVLAMRGARVIVACRNPKKADAMISGFAENLGAELAGRFDSRPCELTSMRSVLSFADSVANVDAVLLNGGVFGLPFEKTSEGFERTYAANYLGHFALVHRLLSKGAFNSGARVVATLSEGVLNPFAGVDVAMLANPTKKRFSRMMASPNTKILLARMAVEFGRRAEVAGCQVTMNGVSPPATVTDNINQGGRVAQILGRALGPMLFKSVEEGATVLAWALVHKDAEGPTGAAFNSRLMRTRLPSHCTDAGLAQMSWDATESALALAPWP